MIFPRTPASNLAIGAAVFGMVTAITTALGNTGNVLMPASREDLIFQIEEAFAIFIFFSIVSIVSQLSRKRARTIASAEERRLEGALKKRLEHLENQRAEEISKLYRFAEFGKLSSGMFHDLMNPLNTVVLSIEKLQLSNENAGTNEHIMRAVRASRRMEEFLGSMRRQIKTDPQEGLFSAQQEIEAAIDMLGHKAHLSGVKLVSKISEDVSLFGMPVKFSQVVINLIANAIESYEKTTSHRKVVYISLVKRNASAVLKITDFGSGIVPELRERIFEPLFTTKESSGTGLGLSTARNSVEKHFGGTLSLQENIPSGTTFIAIFPLRQNHTDAPDI